jgi:hypothetical protein
MAKFNLAATGAALTFAGTALTCLQTVTVGGTAPNTEVECSGTAAVENVVGLPRFTMSLTGALETTGNALLNLIQPGDTGAITFDPAGTASTTLDISSTAATVTDFSATFPVNGFSQYSATFVLDDLTIAANSA